jgi:MFS family permease
VTTTKEPNDPALEKAARWPFDVRRVPFFYGWVIWLVSTVGFLVSVPGQTMGMAVFTDPFIDAFDLSRTQLSFAYLIGTIGSAVLLTRAGRWYDKMGARVMIVASSVALGVFVLLISSIDLIATWIIALTGLKFASVSFALILLGYFGVRFSGQGILTSASRNVLLVWFEKRRGLVSGVRGVFVSLGFSLAPLLLALMIDDFGWRGALWVLAASVGVGFAFLALLLTRDTPESCGLRADGGLAVEAHVVQLNDPNIRAAEARRSPVFWIYAAGLSMHALFGTAVTFHIVAIFAEAGRGRDEAFGYFFPQAIVSLSVNLLASWFADKAPLKPFLIVMLIAFITGAVGLLNLDSNAGYWLLVVGFGAGGGLWGVLSNLAFIRYFGRLHLGEISGMNTSLTVFASAIGPALFSIGTDLFGTYRAAEWICLGGLFALLIGALWIRQEEPPALRASSVSSN